MKLNSFFWCLLLCATLLPMTAIAQPKKLTPQELTTGIKELKGWKLVDGKLRKSYEFKDFVEAFAFMTKVAMAAETTQHHPEWSNVYNRVTIDLVTHDAGGISKLDLDLAKKIDAYGG